MSNIYNDEYLLNICNEFRTILNTTKLSQSTLMYLQPFKNIGSESHDNADQYIYVLDGFGKVIIDNKYEYIVKTGSFIVINKDTIHDVEADYTGLKLLVIYTTILH